MGSRIRPPLMLLMAAVLAAWLLLPAAVASAAPVNDNYASRLTVQLGFADTKNNGTATNEASEPLTPNDPANLGCSKSGTATTGGVKSTGTLWWEFTGNGGPITVSTNGSNFDTVLAVYDASDQSFLACNDDLQPGDATRPNLEYRPASELVIQSISGHHYAVQVGGCSAGQTDPCDPNVPTAGDITLRVSPPPAGDDRTAPIPIAPGTAVNATNTGATTESGEITSCQRAETNSTSLYAKTIWFRYTATARGTAVLSVAGADGNVDTVMALYRADDTTPIDCNDDAIANNFGGSRLPTAQPPGAPVEILPGDYLIQVGGFYDPGFSTVAARNGPLTMQIAFTEDTDIDKDGVSRPQDCNDDDPSVHPAAAEIPNNNVDENCDGVLAYDRDQDGALAPPAGNDCNDTDALIFPGAPDDGDDAVDQDCNGVDAALPQLRPHMTLSSTGRRARTHAAKLSIRPVRAGSTITLSCRGTKRCRRRSEQITINRDSQRFVVQSRLRRILHLRRGQPTAFQPGTRFKIKVVKPGFRSYQRVFRIHRSGKPTYTETCFPPTGPASCSGTVAAAASIE